MKPLTVAQTVAAIIVAAFGTLWTLAAIEDKKRVRTR